MKKIILLLIIICSIASCKESNENILNKVIINLNNIKTVRYQSTLEIHDYDRLILQDTTSIFFDYTNTNSNIPLYHFSFETGEMIYNGEKTFRLNNQEKIITTNDDNRPERLNNPLFLTLNYLKYVTPELIKNEFVIKTRLNDTIINKKGCFAFSFIIKEGYVNQVNYKLEKQENLDSKYVLIIDKNNYLPYKIISPNGKTGLMSRTLENIQLDYQFDNNIWNSKNLPKDYLLLTEKEYFKALNNNVIDNIGKQITDLELPNLKNDKLIKLSDLKGNVTLIEFWFKGCGACIAAVPSLNEIKNRFSNENFKIYGLEFQENYTKGELMDYVKKQNIQFPNLYQGKDMASTYSIKSAPVFMIIDKNGTILDIKLGFSEETINEIIEIIEQNL